MSAIIMDQPPKTGTHSLSVNQTTVGYLKLRDHPQMSRPVFMKETQKAFLTPAPMNPKIKAQQCMLSYSNMSAKLSIRQMSRRKACFQLTALGAIMATATSDSKPVYAATRVEESIREQVQFE